MVCAIETSIQRPRPVALALVQGREDGDRRLEGRVDVGVAERVGGVAAATGVALHLRDAGLGVDDRGVRAAMAPRTARAVAGERGVDQTRVAGHEPVVVEPELGHHARRGSSRPGHRSGRRARGPARHLLRGQVDADVALAGVLLDEVRGQPVDLRRGEPGEVALRRLDLDHLGAEVAQRAGGVWPRQDPREVEDPDAVERSCHCADASDDRWCGPTRAGPAPSGSSTPIRPRSAGPSPRRR